MALRDEYECVAVEIDDDGIAWVTFNRPEKRNAMNPTLHYEMEHLLMELETDPAAKVIVLTGAGNSWSAGMDLKEYFRETDNNPEAQYKSFTANKHWSWDILSNSRKPSIARSCMASSDRKYVRVPANQTRRRPSEREPPGVDTRPWNVVLPSDVGERGAGGSAFRCPRALSGFPRDLFFEPI